MKSGSILGAPLPAVTTMALSQSNVRSALVLDVSLMAAYRDGRSPSLSITSPGFPNAGAASTFSGRDQQLIELEAVISEYAEGTESLPGEKLTVAAFLDRMADLLRRKSLDHEREAGDV